jgi:pimeloyl-ACP methyl ester carboxylesterase
MWPIPDKGLKHRLHRIGAPTLLLRGDRDALMDEAYMAAFAERLPGATLRTVAGGHMLPHESPDGTAAAMLAHFARAA